jgi:very-short-patch-repair endonuclease
MGSYVVDFVCHKNHLIIELDGGHHASQERKDEERSQWLASRGYRVLRFWNHDVLRNTAGVLMEIQKALDVPSPPAGEG